MPRTYKKKKATLARRRKIIKRGIRSIPRRMTPAVFHFKRTLVDVLTIGTPSTGWLLNTANTTLSSSLAFKLSDLLDNSDFVNLFKFYKINGVAMKVYPCTTGAGVNSAGSNNNQIMLRWDANLSGEGGNQGAVATYLNSQTAKSRRLINSAGNPIRIYHKCKQSNMIYQNSAISTAYSLQSPKWIDVVEPDVLHYGFNMCFHRMDATPFGAFSVQNRVRIEYTYYISCKKVQ